MYLVPSRAERGVKPVHGDGVCEGQCVPPDVLRGWHPGDTVFGMTSVGIQSSCAECFSRCIVYALSILLARAYRSLKLEPECQAVQFGIFLPSWLKLR